MSQLFRLGGGAEFVSCVRREFPPILPVKTAAVEAPFLSATPAGREPGSAGSSCSLPPPSLWAEPRVGVNTGSPCFLQGLAPARWVSLGLTGPHWASLGLTGPHWASLGLTAPAEVKLQVWSDSDTDKLTAPGFRALCHRSTGLFLDPTVTSLKAKPGGRV